MKTWVATILCAALLSGVCSAGLVASSDGYVQGQHSSISYSPGMNSQAFTWSAWIMPVVGSQEGVILARGEDLINDHLWGSLSVYGGLRYDYEDCRDDDVSCTTTVSPESGVWSHVVVTGDGLGETALYLNDGLIGDWHACPSHPDCTVDLTIGERYYSPTVRGPYQLIGQWDGGIRDVELYDCVMSQDSDVQFCCCRCSVPAPAALILVGLGTVIVGLIRRRQPKAIQ
jgi:hypothetical protein